MRFPPIIAWRLRLGTMMAACLAGVVGCAGPRTSVIVVPAASDGHIGAVRVSGGGGEFLVDSPFLEVSTDGWSAPSAAPVSPENVAARYAIVRAARPEPPAQFFFYFRTATDLLTEESERELPKVIEELNRRPGADVVLIGHTDRVGLQADNDVLSRKRAQTMASIFEAHGVSANIVQAVGRGEREPLVATADEVAEPKNRRVEVSVR